MVEMVSLAMTAERANAVITGEQSSKSTVFIYFLTNNDLFFSFFFISLNSFLGPSGPKGEASFSGQQGDMGDAGITGVRGYNARPGMCHGIAIMTTCNRRRIFVC